MILRGLLSLLGWLTLASPVAAPVALAPALWVARDGDTTLWLFGTVHQLRPGTPWLTGDVARAFAGCDTLVLELVAPTPAETDAALVDAAPERAPVLPPRLRARLRARVVALGYPAEAFDATDPWFAATTLAAEPLRRAGYATPPAPETLLARLAERAAKPVVGLETQRAQISMFAGLPSDAQQAMLAQVLATPDPVEEMDRTVAAWGAGDVAALTRLTDREMARAGPAIRAALLDRRNARWTKQIMAWLRHPGTRFVAVGAAHLAGPGGLPARLQARGVEVVRMR
jgi:uncharacterized protein YbaP (TraB family)